MRDQPSTALLRRSYAKRVLHIAGVDDPRVEEAFSSIPREDFLPPPPWTTISQGTAKETARVADIYENVLVALDRSQGINNGEPALHAAWLAAVNLQPGERVVHIGTGAGYYTAMLARLVAPSGHVDGFEIHEALALDAVRNLAAFENVRIHANSALGRVLPPADLIYVNAGVAAPDPGWLRALKPGGRMIFPWQPLTNWGNAVLVMRRPEGFSAIPIMGVGFIACTGDERGRIIRENPSAADVARTRSIWLANERAPDATATAVYDDLWFSSREVA
jgi:protein-L-isoaspartate(D-aspartate) O-methyltransferase